MPDTEPVRTVFEIDDRQVKAKFDEFERRIARAEQKGKRAGRGAGGLMSAAIGGAAGFVAGSMTQNPAVSGIMDLVLNVIAAALLPLITKLLPVLIGLGGLIEDMGTLVKKILDIPAVKEGADIVGDMLDIGGDVITGDFDSAEEKRKQFNRDHPRGLFGGLPLLINQGMTARTEEEKQAFRDEVADNPATGWIAGLQRMTDSVTKIREPMIGNFMDRTDLYGPKFAR